MAKGNKNKAVVADEEVRLSNPDETVEIEETIEEEEVEESPKTSAFDILILKDPNTKDYTGAIYVRQFSLKVHGKDFEAIADEFCTKSPKGKVGMYVKVPTEKVGNLEVRFREKKDYDLKLDDQDPNAPIEDKVKSFSNKTEAVVFGTQKIQSTVVVSRKKISK